MSGARIGGTLLTLGSIGIILVAFAALDSYTGGHVASAVQNGGLAWMLSLGSSAAAGLRYQISDYAPIAVFFLAALVFVVLMVRT